MNTRYQTILYATDLTENSAVAFRHAIDLACSNDAALHVLHVLPEMDSSVVSYVAFIVGEDRFSDMELEHEDEMKQTIRGKVEAFVQEHAEDSADCLRHVQSIRVGHGNPVAEILETADELAADLIVIGSHGKGRLKYTFLGSVAEKLLNKSRRPVLTIPLNA